MKDRGFLLHTKYLYTMGIGFDTILYSKLDNEYSDAA